MSLRRTDVLIVGLLLAALLGLFALLLSRRAAAPAAGPSDVSTGAGSGPGGATAPSVSPPPRATGAGVPARAAGSGGTSAPGRGGAGEGTTPAPVDMDKPAVWRPRSPVEFTSADAALFGHGVTVDVGTYRARMESDFEVHVAFESPPLESCTMVFGYDTSMLEVVPGSAVPVGQGFRAGIECYADEDNGRLVLIHRGVPGSKNIDATKGEKVVVWRMRPLQPGTTELVVEEGSRFENGSGQAETLTVLGGRVTIK